MTNDGLSDKEKELFRNHMNGVTPLRKSQKRPIEPIPKNPAPKGASHRKSSVTAIKRRDVYLSNAYHEPVFADTILSFAHKDLPSKRFRELKTGAIAWQARLDLHGLRVDPAQAALLTFLAQATHLNHRCVLIIHGKGGLGTEAPILKNLVNHWLRQMPEVLAFHSAIARDGGTGAVSVLLKRNNPE